MLAVFSGSHLILWNYVSLLVGICKLSMQKVTGSISRISKLKAS